jgi:spermidine synthase
MLGGGGISYPHYYLNKHKNKKMDIVEINPKCIEYAKKYFYLDELIEIIKKD